MEEERPKKPGSEEITKLMIGSLGFIILVAGLFASYLVFPHGIFDIPLAQLTLGMIGRAIGSVVIVIFSLLMAGACWD